MTAYGTYDIIYARPYNGGEKGMENPIREFLDEKGITSIEFARIAGTHGVTAAQLMVGFPMRLSKRFREAIERLGGDPETLSKAYEEWRNLSSEKAVV